MEKQIRFWLPIYVLNIILIFVGCLFKIEFNEVFSFVTYFSFRSASISIVICVILCWILESYFSQHLKKIVYPLSFLFSNIIALGTLYWELFSSLQITAIIEYFFLVYGLAIILSSILCFYRIK